MAISDLVLPETAQANDLVGSALGYKGESLAITKALDITSFCPGANMRRGKLAGFEAIVAYGRSGDELVVQLREERPDDLIAEQWLLRDLDPTKLGNQKVFIDFAKRWGLGGVELLEFVVGNVPAN